MILLSQELDENTNRQWWYQLCLQLYFQKLQSGNHSRGTLTLIEGHVFNCPPPFLFSTEMKKMPKNQPGDLLDKESFFGKRALEGLLAFFHFGSEQEESIKTSYISSSHSSHLTSQATNDCDNTYKLSLWVRPFCYSSNLMITILS